MHYMSQGVGPKAICDYDFVLVKLWSYLYLVCIMVD